MFRRRRHTSHAPINSNPSPSAQTAAVQAFRASQASNANLSSSAAAAALRKHTPPPTSVKDVQTKRMLQRRSSSTSAEAPKRTQRHDVPHGGLKRSQSSGSMTNRTFRERAPASSNPAAREIIDVPPLPRNYVSGNQNQRRFSVDPPYRAISPPNRRVGGNSTPVSIDGFLELDRHSSRGSINFSYPMNARPNSPPLSPTFGVAATDSPRQLEPSPTPPNNELTEQPAGWKAKLQNKPGSDNGSPVRSATSPDSVTTSIDTPKIKSRRSVSEKNIAGATEKSRHVDLGMGSTNASKPNKSRILGATDEHYDGGGSNSTPKAEQSSYGEGSPQDSAQLAPLSIPKKRLSTMLEVEPGENSPQPPVPSKQSPQPAAGHESLTNRNGSAMNEPISVRSAEKARSARSSPDSSNKQPQSPTHKDSQAAALGLLNSNSQRDDQAGRSPSLSPTRSTRFSGRLEVFDSGEPLHEPPPRSKSPAKSALKSATSSQVTHPSGSILQRAIAFDAPSETSDGTSVLSEDGLKKVWKRKVPKVSFEDETEIIDHAQSPPTSPESYIAVSPQFKSPAKATWRGDANWFRPRNMDDQDDLDEVLKPRPILPSFGSVRGGRPSIGDGESTARNVDSAERVTGAASAGHSFSTDGVIGGILSNHKNRPHRIENDDRLFHPLPPEVTSVNGTGYSSSSADSSSSDEGPDLRYFPPRVDKKSFRGNPKSTHTDPEGNSRYPEIEQNKTSPPAISVQPPTPAMEETEYLPELDTLGEQVSAPEVVEKSDHHTEIPAEVEDTETDDTGDSIYSDAVEDMSDLEGGGFGSIDAVVDTPSVRRTSESTSHDGGNTEVENEADKIIPSNLASSVETFPMDNTEDAAEQAEQVSNGEHFEPNAVRRKEPPEKQMPVADINIPNKIDQTLVFDRKPSTMIYDNPILSDPEETTRRRYYTTPPANTDTERKALPQNRDIQSHSQDHIPRTPRRTRSQGSDSSSSFTRMRPARQPGRYSLRRTMRDTPGSSGRLPSDGAGRANTFTAYNNERQPMSSGGERPAMRATMRQPPASSKSSSFSRFGKRKPKAVSGRGQPENSEFHSRFAESSDDELGSTILRPVRGIPRRKNEIEGDSTDLEDSSDNESRSTLRRSRTGQGSSRVPDDSAMAAAMAHVLKTKREASTTSLKLRGKEMSSAPPITDKAQGGLFSRLKRSGRGKGSKIRKQKLENPAGKHTPLERSRSKRDPHDSKLQPSVGAAVSEPSATELTPAKWQPISPRLQQRLSKTANRTGSDSWTLRQNGNPTQSSNTATPNGQGSIHRPHTADGAVENGAAQSKLEHHSLHNNDNSPKPNWTSRFLHSHSRRSPTSDASSVGTSASDIGPSMGTRALKNNDKRAKFPMLKKAFGLERLRRLFLSSLSNPNEFERHSRKDAPQRSVNLDFDARVPIPFSVFPSSYRSDAVSETTHTRVEGEVKLEGASRVGREDTRYEGQLPDPRQSQEVEFETRAQSTDFHHHHQHHQHHHHHSSAHSTFVEEERPRDRYPEVELSRERYYESRPQREFESQLDITEREYRARTDPRYQAQYEPEQRYSRDVDVSYNQVQQPIDTTRPPPQVRELDVTYNQVHHPIDTTRPPPQVRDVEYQSSRTDYRSSVETAPQRPPVERSSNSKMGYYDDDGQYHSFRRGVERAADRILHPLHHGSSSRDEGAVSEAPRSSSRESVRVVQPRGGHPAGTITIPCHFIRIGDLLILQGRPCQVIRISVSPQTGQHRYLGVDLFTRQLHEESSFISHPSSSVVVQSMLGPVYKTYRILDLHEDGHLVAMTENGDVKHGIRVVDQGNLYNRISDAFNEGRGSVRALVINDGGRELVVDYKVIHGSRL